jgi:hypothetical protein
MYVYVCVYVCVCVCGSAGGADASAMGPQVEIVNGKIVLRESSLVGALTHSLTHSFIYFLNILNLALIHTLTHSLTQMVPVHGPVTHEDFEEVEEGIHPTAKYSSFTKHVHSHTWGLEETKQFYEVMCVCVCVCVPSDLVTMALI